MVLNCIQECIVMAILFFLYFIRSLRASILLEIYEVVERKAKPQRESLNQT